MHGRAALYSCSRRVKVLGAGDGSASLRSERSTLLQRVVENGRRPPLLSLSARSDLPRAGNATPSKPAVQLALRTSPTAWWRTQNRLSPSTWLTPPPVCRRRVSPPATAPSDSRQRRIRGGKSPETRVAAPCPRSASCKVSVPAPEDQVSASHAAAAARVLRRGGRSRSNQPCE